MAKNRKFVALLLLSFVLLTANGKALAQSYYVEDPRTFYGGLLLGGNFTQVDGDRFAGYHKLGLNAGGIVYAHLYDKLAASIEILFSQKGSRAHKSQPSTSQAYIITRHNINLNYAEVPIMLNYFDKRKSNFGAGVSYSQLISGSEIIQSNPAFPEKDVAEKYPFKKMDLNFIIGGNLAIYKGLFLNLRFQYSILPIRTTVHPELGRNEQFSNIWTVRMMYLF